MDALTFLMLSLLLSGTILVWSAFISERGDSGTAGRIGSALLFLVPVAWILNDYAGNQTIHGTVASVSKTDTDGTSKIEISKSVKAEFGSSPDILKPYEVAVYPVGSKRLRIFANDNSLWRLKFNKREIQMQLEAGKKYKFRLHRLFLQTNILDIEPE